MDFRTTLDLQQSETKINHQNKILMIGSCFSNNIGQKLIDHKFDVSLNPFGTLYNPISISKALRALLEEKAFEESDIFLDKGQYNSFYFHSSFSSSSRERYLASINSIRNTATEELKESKFLFITFGSSYVYENIETNEIVGNCHKLSASAFRRYRLSVDQIVTAWSELINLLRTVNSELQIIFTVSPIRHLRDGAHDNQLSKSILLLSIDELNKNYQTTTYFPAYEIVLDDLRDYRFYDSDMCHPNSLAIDYIWEKFSDVYFDSATKDIIKRWAKIKQDLSHKPFNPHGEEYLRFLNQSLLKLNKFQSEYPFVCVNSEIEKVKEKINSLHP